MRSPRRSCSSWFRLHTSKAQTMVKGPPRARPRVSCVQSNPCLLCEAHPDHVAHGCEAKASSRFRQVHMQIPLRQQAEMYGTCLRLDRGSTTLPVAPSSATAQYREPTHLRDCGSISKDLATAIMKMTMVTSLVMKALGRGGKRRTNSWKHWWLWLPPHACDAFLTLGRQLVAMCNANS